MKTIGNFIAVSGVVLATTFGFISSSFAQSRSPGFAEQHYNRCLAMVSSIADVYDRQMAILRCQSAYGEQKARQQGINLDPPTNYRPYEPQCGPNQNRVGNTCQDLNRFVPQVR